jgi:hypothetical protein
MYVRRLFTDKAGFQLIVPYIWQDRAANAQVGWAFRVPAYVAVERKFPSSCLVHACSYLVHRFEVYGLCPPRIMKHCSLLCIALLAGIK